MTLPTCRTCRFAFHIEGDEASGWCHRYPPNPMPVQNGFGSTYAVVGLDKAGCGEHEPKRWWHRS